MIVRIVGDVVRLDDPGNFRELTVVGQPAGHPELGRHVGEHLFLDPSILVRLAGVAADEAGWRDGFDAMIAYASSKGWLDESGFVRAHIEPLDRSGPE